MHDEFNKSAHGLRGIAALMVFYAHIFGGSAEHIYAQSEAYVSAVAAPWSVGVFGVNLFFMISGFVIWPSIVRYEPWDFAKRRFVRIYPLFLVLTILFIVLNGMTNAYPKLNNLGTIIPAFFFLDLYTHTDQLTPNAWSLTYEVHYYALACLAYHFIARRFHPLGAALAGLACIGFLFAFPITFYFIGGVLVRTVYDRQLIRSTLLVRTVEVVAFPMMIWLASLGHVEYVWARFADGFVPLRIYFSILYFCCAVQPGSLTSLLLRNKVAAYLGTVSYSLYLVHPYTYYATRLLFKKFGLFTPDIALSMTTFALVTTAVTIPLTHLFWRTFETMPYRIIFGQWVYRDQAQERPPRGILGLFRGIGRRSASPTVTP
ncbi:acyltransferase family protein [Prosthecomicrobium sp. N25]|uniref:acyltransferase family protein n=1 Tax=Prosthecomicrobium sp. N25 TaxID=3129254 RepID=UPI0030783FE1